MYLKLNFRGSANMRKSELKEFYYKNEKISYDDIRGVLGKAMTNKDINLLSEQLDSLYVEDFMKHFLEADIQQNKVYLYDGKPLNLELFSNSLGVSEIFIKTLYRENGFEDLKDLEIHLNNNKRKYDYKGSHMNLTEFSKIVGFSNAHISNLIRVLQASTLDKVEEFINYSKENYYNFVYNGENGHIKKLITKHKLKTLHKDISVTNLVMLSMVLKTFNINEILKLIDEDSLKEVVYNDKIYTLKELCVEENIDLLVMIYFMYGVNNIDEMTEKLRYFRFRKKDNVYLYNGKKIDKTLDTYLNKLGVSRITLYRLIKELDTVDIYDIEVYLSKSKEEKEKLKPKLSKYSLNGKRLTKEELYKSGYDLKELERMRKVTGETEINELLKLIEKDLENSYTYNGKRMTIQNLANQLGVTRQYVSLVGVNLKTRKLEEIEEHILRGRNAS